MKINIPLLPVLPVLSALLLLASCGKKTPDAEAEVTATETASPAPCCPEHGPAAPVNPAAPLPDTSLYQLEGEWQDHRGNTYPLKNLRGQVRIVTMGFTHCEYVCPRLVMDLKRFRENLIHQGRTDVGYVFISFDPDRDSPQVMADFAKKLAADGPDWTYLRGDANQVREIAAVLGINYQKQPNGSFSHSNVFAAVDREGRIVHQVNTIQDDAAPFAEKLPK